MLNRFKNIGEKFAKGETKKVSATPTSDKERARKKLLKIVGIIAGVFVLLLLIIFLLSVIIGRNYSYDQIEQILKNAGIKYYKVQEVLLPSNEGETSEVDASTLASENYKLMKPLSKLRKNDTCSGKVVVQKVNNDYVYTPYLDCGDKYKTEELYKAVIELNKPVTSGNGLYQMNGEYVFRGETVNNYLKLSKGLFRIVKITSDNKILLIPQFDTYYSGVWDDRYNNEMGFSTGINAYQPSRIRTTLATIYSSKIDNFTLLSDNDRQKLTSFALCIGKRGPEEENNSGSVECSDTLDNQMIGLLTVSDYLNASIDDNCKKTTSKSCQNYNYLKTKGTPWWLITAINTKTSDVYYVNTDGYVQNSNALNYSYVRPTVMLNNNVMIKSGVGTEKEPFILK